MRRLLPVLLALGVLSACSATATPSAAPATETSHQRVDSPALRSLKASAGVESCAPGTAPTTHGTTALPALTLPCLGGGRPVDLGRLRGPLVVNLFASWCGPCREEMPFYQQLHKAAGDKVRVLGVDYLDPNPAGALELARQTGATYPLVADPGGDLKALLHTPGRSSPVVIQGLPGIVFVDARGHITDVELRVVRSFAELRGLVRQHLGVAVS